MKIGTWDLFRLIRIIRTIRNFMLSKNLNFKMKKDIPSSGRAKILIVTIVALIALLAEVQIVLASQIATTGEKIKNLENRKDVLSLEINRSQVEVNKVSSLSYIEKKARSELGMTDGVNRVEYISTIEHLASLQ